MKSLLIITMLFLIVPSCKKIKKKHHAIEGVERKWEPNLTGTKVLTKHEKLKSKKIVKKRISITSKGRWYPASKKLLDKTVKGFINNAKVAPINNVMALIAPHAGYEYSGQTAAYAYKTVLGKSFKRVIVLGPSHYSLLKNKLVIPSSDYYSTPYGDVGLDLGFIKKLIKSPYFVRDDKPFLTEHSVDNQMPFIQYSVREFTVVPIIVGYLDKKTLLEVGKLLNKLVDNDTLIVVSSDFTHYGTSYNYVPFTENVEENIKKLDFKAAGLIEQQNLDKFISFKQETGDTICGFMPISLLLATLPATTKARVIKYETSGQLTGDYTRSVSYFAFVFTGKWKTDMVSVDKSWQLKNLNNDQKKSLLKYSRLVLNKYVINKKIITPEESDIAMYPIFKQKSGAFVTLTKKGILRGCIGEIPPRRALIDVIKDHTIDAAVNDHRFRPVTRSELPDIMIEISVLTPPHKIDSYKQIKLGKHGIVIQKNNHSAVYLPQVAPEQGWDIPTTLTYLSRKAGLPSDAWKQGATFYVFEAIVFSEKDFGLKPLEPTGIKK